jgi:alkyl hydroperoxide reductase subunit D
MSLEQLLSTVPGYANDLTHNIGVVLRQKELTAQQTWGTAVSCAIAARNPRLLGAILADAAPHLNQQSLDAAKAAAAVMGMNNIFYRFRHFTSNEKYTRIPARLRMQVVRTHGSDPVDFELWCLAVSAMNGCEVCVDAHEKTLREKGMSEESIVAVVRIASVIHALAAVVEAELAIRGGRS